MAPSAVPTVLLAGGLGASWFVLGSYRPGTMWYASRPVNSVSLVTFLPGFKQNVSYIRP